MPWGEKIETRGHRVGFIEEIAKAAAKSQDDFFSWFSDAGGKDAAFVRGAWDFAIHVAQPCARYLREPEKKVALDIGYGGGRILAAASRAFSHVVGVDVHEQDQLVAGELRSRGLTNFALHRTDGRTIPVADGSIDLAYSFIVMQHVEKIEVFSTYLREVFRVLHPDGIAVIYFGRLSFLSNLRGSRTLLAVDRVLERIAMTPRGYREIPACVNQTNLYVSLSHARRMARRIGFSVLTSVTSRKRVPDGYGLYGAQSGLVLRKPD